MMGRRGRSFRSGAVACLLLGGCDYIFRVDHVPYHADAASETDSPNVDSTTADGPMDGSTSRCKNGPPLLAEPFDTSTQICQTWGSAYSDPGVTVTQTGVLRITSNPTTAAVGGCLSEAGTRFAFTGEGVMAKVDSIIMDGSAYNVLQIEGPPNLVIKAGQNMIGFQTAASVQIGQAINYASSQKYWRIRPDPSVNNAIMAEISIDGETWSTLGDSYATASLPTTVGIQVSFGTNAAGGSGDATVDELLVCP